MDVLGVAIESNGLGLHRGVLLSLATFSFFSSLVFVLGSPPIAAQPVLYVSLVAGALATVGSLVTRAEGAVGLLLSTLAMSLLGLVLGFTALFALLPTVRERSG